MAEAKPVAESSDHRDLLRPENSVGEGNVLGGLERQPRAGFIGESRHDIQGFDQVIEFATASGLYGAVESADRPSASGPRQYAPLPEESQQCSTLIG